VSVAPSHHRFHSLCFCQVPLRFSSAVLLSGNGLVSRMLLTAVVSVKSMFQCRLNGLSAASCVCRVSAKSLCVVHAVHPRLLSLYGDKSGYHHFLLRHGDAKPEVYMTELYNATFCLCPLGYATWSPRLVDSYAPMNFWIESQF